MVSKTIIVFVSILLMLPGSCSNWPGVSEDSSPPGGGYQLQDTSGTLGSSCGPATACSRDLTCVSQAPDGICTQGCLSNADCKGGVCVWYQPWGGLACFKACVSDQLCRPRYSCQSTGTDDVCAPGSIWGVDGG